MAAVAPAEPALARPGVALEWNDLAFEVPMKAAEAGGPTTKRILSPLSGRATPGTLTLLMGPSGAGKTTLLNLLSQRTAATGGGLLLNGEKPTHSFQRVQAFVEQEFVQFETLTVLEILRTTAKLKLPESQHGAELTRRVADVIASLDLAKCQNTRVSGCSGGEKRRLAVAAELLGQPSLLFLDEPTTGLDANAARSVVRILRRLAKEQHRTIICTIHQPRASLLPLADQLILLADGRQVYGGPTFTPGLSDGMLAYFSGLGFPCSAVDNPADHIVDLVNTRDGDEPELAAAKQAGEAAATGSGGDAASLGDVAGGRVEGRADRASGDDVASSAEDGAPPSGDAEEDDDALLEAESKTRLSPLVATTGWEGDSEAASLFAVEDEAERAATAAARRASLSREAFVEWMAGHFAASDVRRSVTAAVSGGAMPAMPAELASSSGSAARPGRYPTTCCTQCCVVSNRTFLFKLREPEAVATQATNLVLVALILGWVYFGLPATLKGTQDRFGFIAMFFLVMAFAPIDLLTLFPRERQVFVRDTNANLYGTLAFFAGRNLAELPAHVLLTAIGSTIVYFMVGLQPDAGKFAIFLLDAELMILTGASLLQLCSTMGRSLAEANGIGIIMLMLAMIFNGFFISAENTPVVFRWINDISFLRFGLEAAMVNEFSGLTISCSAEDLTLGCITDGTKVLEARNLPTTQESIWVAFGWLALQLVVMRVLSFLFLHFLYTGKSLSVRARQFCEW